MVTGKNDMTSAKVLSFGTLYLFGDTTRDERKVFELNFQKMCIEFNEKTSMKLNFYVFTASGLSESFSNDIQSDLILIQISLGLVAVYCIFFMGSCSPIHFRSAAAGITLLCVGLSYAASTGLAQYFGVPTAGIHSILPFLLIGIGVDDMFVISTAIDQTNTRLTVQERMREGMVHAG